QAAGYLGDSYFLRCRDLNAGNLRDVPAHMMSDIVDDQSGNPIDTDDMLDDLARVAHEVVGGSEQDDGTGEFEAPATVIVTESAPEPLEDGKSPPQSAG
ncbi:MAG TPA: hypothetical protein PLJ12_04720, partial [Planctomycetota bacterium]|nr:hypothetical protein [Planctomycetota bacterium]